MNIKIIFEDQDILIINKPAGLVVNQTKTVKELTLQDWLGKRLSKKDFKDWQKLVPANFSEKFGTAEEIFKNRLGLAHRLDKNTSGVMVAAKNPGSLVNLLAQFQQRQISKKYICLAHNKFRVPLGTIRAPLGRARVDRQKFAVVSNGRPAVTTYKVVNYYSGLNKQGKEKLKDFKKKVSVYQGFSLVHCWPKTGRTHQIRVHLKHWKHPLVGDNKYVGKKRAKLDAVWCPRQFLHASWIELIHPRINQKINFKVELAADLKEALKLLQL
jgi:23S rRNA pseudouridine1911/1915/1917 synthase